MSYNNICSDTETETDTPEKRSRKLQCTMSQMKDETADAESVFFNFSNAPTYSTLCRDT